jgi:hypothetical protein
MRTAKNLLLPFIAILFIASGPVSAQRHSDHRGDGGGSSRSGGGRSFDAPRSGNSSRSFSPRSSEPRSVAPPSYNRSGSVFNRMAPSYSRPSVSTRNNPVAYNRPSSNNRIYGSNRYGNTYRGYDTRRYSGRNYYGYNRNYYSYNNHFGYHSYRYGYPGQHIYLNRPSIFINFGGYRYTYYDGIFYRPWGSYYTIVAPPLGIHIGMLPYGYRTFYLGDDDYYYYNGIYYRHYDDYYEVVTPPIGAEVAEIPDGARPLVIDGHKYYEYNGTYYRETPHSNGEMWYTIMGKDGVMTGTSDSDQYNNNISPDSDNLNYAPPVNNGPELGSEVTSLPDNTHTVVVNNQKYFVTQDDVYYQERIDNNQIYYRVVVKPGR